MPDLDLGAVTALGYLPPAGLKTTPAIIEASPLPANMPKSLDSPLSWVGKKLDDDSSSIVYLSEADKEELTRALKHFRHTPNSSSILSLGSQLTWDGNKADQDTSYILHLNDDDKLELQQALAHFNSLGLDGDLVSKDTFPLRKLAAKLDCMRHDVYRGRGFGLVRGLDTEKFSLEDMTVVYLGIQVHIGNRFGRQDKKGNMLVHIVADNSSQVAAEHHRHSTAPITFHTEESGDVVSWFTQNTATAGGMCIIASAYTVYNTLAATRPDLVRVLARADWPFALPKFHCRPIIHFEDGKLITNFGRTPLMGSPSNPRPDNLPKLSPIQLEALDMIESIAKATQLEMTTQPGDIHFINNFAMLHRREGFVDGAEMHQKRHMIRTRLRDDELGWKVPEHLAQEWEEAFGSSGTKMWHLKPMPEGFFPLRGHAN